MSKFTNEAGSKVVFDLIKAIQENKQYLSDIDGAIGDGDHGINMNKGFTLCEEDLKAKPGNMSYSFNILSRILMLKIGGSMGPLYGKFFKALSKGSEGVDEIDAKTVKAMLDGALEAIQSISQAKPGDKTLMDTLVPAVETYSNALEQGKSLREALDDMKQAAIEGRDSTKDMVAKIGRSSRLGERSKGTLDAGATSCCLILETMANSMKALAG